jgi:hypothetical protein
MKELKEAVEGCMDRLGVSRELPHADDTDIDMHVVEARQPSYPGARTPGRPTGPISRNRPPGSRPQISRPPGRGPATVRSQPPTQLTPPPQRSRVALFVGIAAAVVVAGGAGAFVFLRDGRTPAVAATRPQAEAVKHDETPVFLSIVSEPLDADVVATWRDGGEKRGAAPLSLEVPRNAKVHFEFRKTGYVDYAMDVIADQPQTVQAILKAEPKSTPAPVVVEASDRKPERKSRPEKRRTKKERSPKPDGVVDVLDDLK